MATNAPVEAKTAAESSPGNPKKRADALVAADHAVTSNDVDSDIQFLWVQHQIHTDEDYARNLQGLQIINDDDAGKERSAAADPGSWTEVSGKKKSAKAVSGQHKLINEQEQERLGKVSNDTEATSKRVREQVVLAAGVSV